MNFGVEWYINGKFTDSYKKYKKYYYLYSNENDHMIHMNISYCSSESQGNNEIICAIKIGYVNGNTQEINICKYETDKYYGNIPIDMQGVLIVIIYLDCDTFPSNDEFNILFKKEIDLYYNSDFGYPTDFDDVDTVESDDPYQTLLASMNNCMISSKNDSCADENMC